MRKVLAWYRFGITLLLLSIAIVLSGFLTGFTNADELASLLDGYPVR